jgi:para-nitrobenzyl esterase
MKQFSLFGLLLCMASFALHAQNPGCDGTRYKADVFSNVVKTTVDYAPTINHLGQPFILKMDIYEPAGDNISKRPVVILAHGGSFAFGDRSDMDPYCRILAKKGYIAATIQYRLFPFILLGLPDSVDIMDTAVKAVADMRAAVRYFRQDAATTNQFKADPDNIFIGGYSAGAVTALHTAYLDASDDIPSFLQTLINNNGGWTGNSGSASNQTYPADAKAVISMSGGLYRREWIESGDLPLVSIHGTADQTVAYNSGLAANIAYLEGSGLLHPRATAVNVWNYLETVPGGGHSDIYDQPQFAAQFNSFITQTTTLLESITCGTFSSSDSPESIDTESMRIVPNPGSGPEVRLQLPEDIRNVQVWVYDAQGRTVLFNTRYQPGTALGLPAALPAGQYTVAARGLLNDKTSWFIQSMIRQ